MLVNYWIRQGVNVQGPFALDAVRQLVADGRVKDSMLVSTDQLNWRIVGDVPELYVGAAATGAPATPALTPSFPMRTPPPPANAPRSRAPERNTHRAHARSARGAGSQAPRGRRATRRAPSSRRDHGSGAPRGSGGARTLLVGAAILVLGVVGVAFALRGGGPGAGEKSRSSEEIVQDAERSVALIKDQVVSGTGFLVTPNLLATNAHVVRRMLTSDMEVYFPSMGKRRYTVDWIVYLDDRLDLALLLLAANLEPLPLASDRIPGRGEELLLIGNPGVGDGIILENAVSRGLSGSSTLIEGREYLQISASINPGNSGGPAIDRRGRVVGMVTMKAANKEGLAFAVPASAIASAVRRQEDLSSSDRMKLNQKLIAGAIFLRLRMAGKAFLGLTLLQVDGLRTALEAGARTIESAERFLPDLTQQTAQVRSGIGAHLDRYLRLIEGSAWMNEETREDLLAYQQIVQTFDQRASRPDVLSVISYIEEFETLHDKYKAFDKRLEQRFEVPADE